MLHIPIEILVDFFNNIDIHDYVKIYVIGKMYKKYIFLYCKYKDNKLIINFLKIYDYVFMLT